MTTKVVNIYHRTPYDIYIGRGRGSIWGNPYSHMPGTLAEFKVATRAEAIVAYEAWLPSQPSLMLRLAQLKDKVLGCWCKPAPCHGDVLARLADALPEPEDLLGDFDLSLEDPDMAKPRLTRVTRVALTGADDNTDPKDLAALSDEFPFVEWGILFSITRMGTPRYPTAEWVESLKPFASRLKLAAHFCDQYTRDTLAGDDKWLVGKEDLFQRIQLNGFKPSDGDVVTNLSRGRDFEFILQTRQEDLVSVATIAMHMGKLKASILYAPSGGKGIDTAQWPALPHGIRMGYAGGITPDNVKQVPRSLDNPSSSYWIDLESGVRTDERFDLAKCRKVLEAWDQWDGAGPWNGC